VALAGYFFNITVAELTLAQGVTAPSWRSPRSALVLRKQGERSPSVRPACCTIDSQSVSFSATAFFFLGAYGGVNVVLASYYPEALRAVGICWTKSVGRIGTIIAPVLIGYGLAAGIAETTVMSLFALPCALAVLALLVIGIQGQRSTLTRPDL